MIKHFVPPIAALGPRGHSIATPIFPTPVMIWRKYGLDCNNLMGRRKSFETPKGPGMPTCNESHTASLELLSYVLL